jgi:hypothetical protein
MAVERRPKEREEQLMNIRERQTDPREPRQVEAGTDGGADLTAARADADGLLAAADDAIERALSADSTAFLAANRQRGGQ